MSYQYDLFISFKNSTDLGLTEDRGVAENFFEVLNKNNFKVFFSNAVLTDKGVANYMLEIQNALEESKAILVVFSRVEYISQGWVAQEWMTFLNLLMKDPNRNIYIFSIKNDNTKLPPFLRPYECFGDYNAAIKHLTNGLKNNDVVKKIGIGKRDFLNAYWGLFGNTDIYEYLDKPMNDPFYNYEVYCLKSKFIGGGDVDEYITGLTNLIDNNLNPLAAYLLSRHYRDVRYLNLHSSRKLAEGAFLSFNKKIENSSKESEVGLWILSNTNEYDGAFYMCDIIHDVLDAYEVATDIKILNPRDLDKIDFASKSRVVLFWADACLEIPEEFVLKINQNKNNVYICLNSFGETAVPYNLKQCQLFENSNMDITKLCRTLLS